MSKANCVACINIIYGVKTRISVEHTCGRSSEEMKRINGRILIIDELEKNTHTRAVIVEKYKDVKYFLKPK